MYVCLHARFPICVTSAGIYDRTPGSLDQPLKIGNPPGIKEGIAVVAAYNVFDTTMVEGHRVRDE